MNGAPLDPLASLGYYIIVATAGHDTTSSSTGGGMWALAETPGEFAKLKADPALIPDFSVLDEEIGDAVRLTQGGKVVSARLLG